MNFKKLPISVGILSWNSDEVLVNTLESYKKNGLFEIINDASIFFQEFNSRDQEISEHYNINYMSCRGNIGIGKAFAKLAKNAKATFFLPLEHDFELVESKKVTFKRLSESIDLIESGIDLIKLRHRIHYGEPLFSKETYEGRELEVWEPYSELNSTHLLSCIHWISNPEKKFSQLKKSGEYYTTTSRWANWTNNPVLLKRDFYINHIAPFAGDNVELERNLTFWWPRQPFQLAQGEGLFKHNDFLKYSKLSTQQDYKGKLTKSLKGIIKRFRNICSS